MDKNKMRKLHSNDLRLGVNIDHVATIRNARGIDHPNPLRAALIAARAGADGITAHLREDRRHISDADIEALSDQLTIPLNLEIAATEEMLAIALKHKPHAVCIVPEKREEVTTEGGLNAARFHDYLAPYVRSLVDENIRVSLFLEPDRTQLEAARSLGAPVVELHTGRYCELQGSLRTAELERLRDAASFGTSLGLEIHAGHGLSFDTVKPVAAIADLKELNIGHFLIGEAIFAGLAPAIAKMRHLIDQARSQQAPDRDMLDHGKE